MSLLTALAPAKVNLFLHVAPLQADGFHPIASLVAFADVGDVVTVEPSDGLSLEIIGPFADALKVPSLQPGADNLILRALRTLGCATGTGDPALKVRLDKRLPIAAGLGGGSSDAGAALKLARQALSLDIDDVGLEAVAASVGADGPMCLRGRSVWAEGRGDRLTDEPRLPPLHVLLVNPGVPSPTGAVYRGYDAGQARSADMPSPPTDWTAGAIINWLAEARNDLQPPAVGLTQKIQDALFAVSTLPGVRLCRMSGSGATVFGLFDDADAAKAAAKILSRDQGDWWVKAALLGGDAAAIPL